MAAGAVLSGVAGHAACRPSSDLAVLRIDAIQGDGAMSLSAGGTVVAEGVVTGVFQREDQLLGFFMQETVGDGNERTSDGIFVQAGLEFTVRPGDLVSVTGTVAEVNGQTMLTDILQMRRVGRGSVSPVALVLPLADPVDLEQLEGMVVTIPDVMTVTSANDLGRVGQLTLSSQGRLFVPTNLLDPNDDPPSGTTAAGSGNVDRIVAVTRRAVRQRIVLDDGSNVTSPRRVPYLSNAGTRRLGDQVSGLTGIIDEDDGIYRLQPIEPPTFVDTNRRSHRPPQVGGSLRVGFINLFNYFTTVGQRGAATAAELERQRIKLVSALLGLEADVIGLAEVENNGDDQGSAIADLVGGLNDDASRSRFDHVRDPAEGIGADAIKVALIFRPENMEPIGPPVSAPDPLFERWPLAQTFRHRQTGGVFSVVVVHFKSKAGEGLGADADQGDGQGAFNARRRLQAEATVRFLRRVTTLARDPDVLLIGDLNAYLEEDPIDTLRHDGLVDLLSGFVRTPYSFVFEGQAGLLDYAMVTSSLSSQVTGATIWHINADEPPMFGFRAATGGADGATPADDSPYRAADHDPVIVGLSLRR